MACEECHDRRWELLTNAGRELFEYDAFVAQCSQGEYPTIGSLGPGQLTRCVGKPIPHELDESLRFREEDTRRGGTVLTDTTLSLVVVVRPGVDHHLQ